MDSKIRLTLASNANQKISTVVILPQKSITRDDLVKTSKNKLKMKKPIRFFLKTRHDVVQELGTDDDFKLITSETTVFASAGEDYVGKEAVTSVITSHSTDVTSSLHVPVVTLHKNAFVETVAIKQLEKTARLSDMRLCAGMPDLHAGNEYPIGATFATQDIIYPHLIGGDIGCGMTMYRLSVSSSSIVGNEHRVASQMTDLEGPWPGDVAALLRSSNLESSEFDASLGTVGRGNHFAEIQVVHQIHDTTAFQECGFTNDRAYLLIHSGSRGLGKHVLERHCETYGKDGLRRGTPEFDTYLSRHNDALQWATLNRELIGQRVLDALSISQEAKLVDIWHNNVEEKELSDGSRVLLHRKGAAPSDRGVIAIPGSRGSLTYIVQPTGHQERNLFSVAHGAGREMSRTKAAQKLQSKHANRKILIEKLTENAYGGVVVCEDLELLCEEAPEAYKDVDAVVQDLVDEGIVRSVATLKPLVTYKMRRAE